MVRKCRLATVCDPAGSWSGKPFYIFLVVAKPADVFCYAENGGRFSISGSFCLQEGCNVWNANMLPTQKKPLRAVMTRHHMHSTGGVKTNTMCAYEHNAHGSQLILMPEAELRHTRGRHFCRINSHTETKTRPRKVVNISPGHFPSCFLLRRFATRFA